MLIIYLYVAIFGSFLASFYYVLALRTMEKISILGRSHCDVCKTKLNFLKVIPILGYMLSRGKCNNCNSKINIKYPLFEIILGFLFFMSFYIFEFKIETIIGWLLISLLSIASILDLEYRVVLDRVFIPFAGIFIAITIINKDYINIIISLVIFLFFFFIAIIFEKIFKQEALGGADIKLFAILGLVLGFNKIILAIFISSCTALIFSKIFRLNKKSYLPYIPFISLGAITAFFFGDVIINTYIKFLFSL